MAFISLLQWLDHTAGHGHGVPASHVSKLEQIPANREVAAKTRRPEILQASATNPGDFGLRKAQIAERKAARSTCSQRSEALGCAGHADGIKPVLLDAMARRRA